MFPTYFNSINYKPTYYSTNILNILYYHYIPTAPEVWHSHTRPLMIIRQYKTVFKQYSFSRKCWVGPGGESQLLPKSNGYSRMVSGFASRCFGVGLYLSEVELNKVNERRIGSQWRESISKNEAIKVYGTTKKEEDSRSTSPCEIL